AGREKTNSKELSSVSPSATNTSKESSGESCNQSQSNQAPSDGATSTSSQSSSSPLISQSSVKAITGQKVELRATKSAIRAPADLRSTATPSLKSQLTITSESSKSGTCAQRVQNTASQANKAGNGPQASTFTEKANVTTASAPPKLQLNASTLNSSQGSVAGS